MLPITIGVLFFSSGALCAPSDAVEVGVCDGDGCSALKSIIGATEKARKELGCCTHDDCPPSITTVLCAHDVVTHFFQDAGTSKVCSDLNQQCEALRVVKMNLQLSKNILGCPEREERAFISSSTTPKLLRDLLPQSVVTAIHDLLPDSLHLAKVQHAVGSAGALATGVALAGGLSSYKGNVYVNVGSGIWGGVCADTFTKIDAETVCWQLGFSGVKDFYGVNAGNKFGPVPDPFAILLANAGAKCTVSPPTAPLSSCPGWAAAIATPVCGSGEVAAVECEA